MSTKFTKLFWLLMWGALLPVASLQAQARDDKARDKAAAPASESVGVKGEVLVILASEKPGKIDPQLKNEPALKHRSFRGYKSMKLLANPELHCVVDKPVFVKLPNGRQLRLVLEKVLPDNRYKVKLSINKPNETDYVRSVQLLLAPGVPVFQAGQRHGDEDLILGIRLGERAKQAKTGE